MARMRVRIALVLAFLATAIGLVIDMSGSAPRLAGSDHIHWPPVSIVGTLQSPGSLCLTNTALPSDAARMVITIGSFGRPLPKLGLTFRSPTGRLLATGGLPYGAHEGEAVSIPFRYPHGASAVGTLCLRSFGRHPLVFYGWLGQGAPVTINGATVTNDGTVSILYYRPGSESWWDLLGALDLRFGLGKSPFFGRWTLPVLALVVLALWVGVARVLIRELR
jgi:hypothetical protein